MAKRKKKREAAREAVEDQRLQIIQGIPVFELRGEDYISPQELEKAIAETTSASTPPKIWLSMRDRAVGPGMVYTIYGDPDYLKTIESHLKEADQSQAVWTRSKGMMWSKGSALSVENLAKVLQ